MQRFQFAVQPVLPQRIRRIAEQVVDHVAVALFVVPAPPGFGECVHDAELRG